MSCMWRRLAWTANPRTIVHYTSTQCLTMAEGGASDEGQRCKAVKKNGRYITPWGATRPSMTAVLKWQLFEKNQSDVGGTWKSFWKFKTEKLDRDLPVIRPEKDTLSNPPSDGIQVTWIGHATVLVQMDGLNILTDPLFNEYCGPTRAVGVFRYRPVPLAVGDLPEIDAVCISHDHYDHLDHWTVCQLNERFRKCHWFVPMGRADWMEGCGCENVTELEWWDEKVHPKHQDPCQAVKFVFLPAQHWCRRGVTDENKALWGSWAVIGPKHRFFFAGDTGYCGQFKVIGKEYGPFDFSAIPIGAYHPRWFMEYQHVDPEHAVEIHEDVKSQSTLGVHWGTFALGFEHYLDAPKELKEACDKKRLPDSKFYVIKHGEVKVIKKDSQK